MLGRGSLIKTSTRCGKLSDFLLTNVVCSGNPREERYVLYVCTLQDRLLVDVDNRIRASCLLQTSGCDVYPSQVTKTTDVYEVCLMQASQARLVRGNSEYGALEGRRVQTDPVQSL